MACCRGEVKQDFDKAEIEYKARELEKNLTKKYDNYVALDDCSGRGRLQQTEGIATSPWLPD